MNQNRTQHYTTLALITVACAGLCGSDPRAASCVVAPKPPGWETSAAAGVTLTRGNSDTLPATLSLDTKRSGKETRLAASPPVTRNDDTKNTEFVKGYAQYNHLFTGASTSVSA
jgi:hypothetical protein